MVALDDPVDRGSGLRVHFSEIFAGTRRHLASATGFTCNPSLPPDSRSEPVFSRMAILPWFDNSGCTQTLPASTPSSLRRSCPSDRIIAGLSPGIPSVGKGLHECLSRGDPKRRRKRGIEKETSLDIPQTGMVSNVDGVHPNRGMVDAADADGHDRHRFHVTARKSTSMICLLYTSDAADEE